MTGNFIVFEGLTASGKKTQIHLLNEWFTNQNKKVVKISFPSYGNQIGDMIKTWTRKNFAVDNKTMAMLFAADRSQMESQIKKWLEDDWVVLCDRYSYSNIAYQSAKGLDKNWLIDLERETIKPDLVFYLDLSDEDASKRYNIQLGLDKFIEMKRSRPQPALSNKIREEYISISENPPYGEKIHTIDGTKTIMQIHNDICKIIENEIV